MIPVAGDPASVSMSALRAEHAGRCRPAGVSTQTTLAEVDAALDKETEPTNGKQSRNPNRSDNRSLLVAPCPGEKKETVART